MNALSTRTIRCLGSLFTSRASNTRFLSTLTPEEAGRRAEKIALQSTVGKNETSLDTLLAHAGLSKTGTGNASMSPPIHMATTYARPADGPYKEGDSIYIRADNPTRLLLETEIAQLECHGRDLPISADSATCCAFSSGMMAASSIILCHSAPMKVLLPKDLYHGVPTMLHEVFSRFQVSVEPVDMTTNALDLEKKLAQVAEGSDIIVWMETPSNPLCQIVDVATICQVVEMYRNETSRKVTTVVDSTLAPPPLTQPLHLGADLVMHSATKYLGGHSDVLLGVVSCSPWTERGRELGPLLQQVQVCVGGVASSFDSWLTLRGLRTLGTRVERQCRSAMQLASYMQDHPLVHAVHYPGLETHPQHAIAKRQMKGGYGGVFSVELENESLAMAFAGALRTIQRATSLGGTETLIEHRKSIEPADRITSPAGLLRLSVGLESPADLISDIEHALSIVQQIRDDDLS
jgi:cystathionine gamma-synthase